ncbi:DUF5686 family protein [Aureispira anguillae]|uniref:DUF5686 family protein n=1 Tax=Aureispira anguillae TaxID=2864201 RepID=A0A916DP05_9BACT|nr:DUF5686 family protein [Aureispira anguillae]BDS09876.1 DUF5686 family protein [Aureispira anguillae]
MINRASYFFLLLVLVAQESLAQPKHQLTIAYTGGQIYQKENAFHASPSNNDSIKRKAKLKKTVETLFPILVSAYIPIGAIELGKYSEILSWNKIEGIRLKLGVRTTEKWNKKIQFHAYAAYGSSDKKWKYKAGFKTLLSSPKDQQATLSVSYQSDLRAIGQYGAQLSHDNIIHSILNDVPLNYLMQVCETLLNYEKHWLNGFYSSIGYHWQQFKSISNGLQFTQNEGKKNSSAFVTSAIRIKSRWKAKKHFEKKPTNPRKKILNASFPTLNFEYTIGIKGLLKGEYNYQHLDFSIQQQVTSFLGATQYQIKASKFFGAIPYPIMTVHLGNESILDNPLAYALVNEFEFVSDAYTSVWVNHHFNGLFFSKIPFVKRLNICSILIFKGMYGVLSKQSSNLYDLPNEISAPNFYAEIGWGFENILKIVRIDFMWRLTHLTALNVRPFGLKISFAPKF